jgi:SAM-dependent methyltransferase
VAGTDRVEDPHARSDAELLLANQRFYDALWMGAKLVSPERFNTWPIVSALLSQASRRLEIGPGLRPRFPIADTYFVEISAPALTQLHARGGLVALGRATALPFDDCAFDLLGALDIVEHIDDDDAVFSELARVAKPGAILLLSAPLHTSHWTPVDYIVGHRRRYEPHWLLRMLRQHGFYVERSAGYGMQPRPTWLVQIGLWYLQHKRKRAIWWYNRVMMPLALRLQRPLRFQAGMIQTNPIDEILLVCRRRS